MENSESKQVNFIKVYLIAVLIFIVDAYFWGQGIVAGATIFFSGCILLPISIYKKSKFLGGTQHIKKYIIYSISACLVLVANFANNKIAIHRSEILVKNIESYKKENGTYPQKLEQLVPKYYSSVPSAKISSTGSFYYHKKNQDDPILFYVIYPPHYRNSYNFQSKKWHKFD